MSSQNNSSVAQSMTTRNPRQRSYVTMTEATFAHSVDILHPTYIKRAPQWEKIRDCFEGEDQVKSKKERYMPPRDKQEQAEFDAYLDRAQFVNFVSRTIDSLTSSIFRRKETLVLPAGMSYLQSSATPDGLSVRQLGRWLAQEILLLSRAGLLLDLPKEMTVGALPLISRYTAESILSWDDDNPVPKWILLAESKKDDSFSVFSGTKTATYLLLALDAAGDYCVSNPTAKQLSGCRNIQTLLLELGNAGDLRYPLVYGKKLTDIPFQFVGAIENIAKIQKPMMLDIVNVNLAHYRGSANLETSRHYVGSPVYVIKSDADTDDGEEMVISPTRVWELGQNDEAEILEFKGTGLSSLENGQEEKEEQLRTLGAVLLSQRKNAAARSSGSDTDVLASRDATLSDVVESINAAMLHLLKLAAQWTSNDPSAVDFYLNKHFSVPEVGARELRALEGMVGKTILAEDMYTVMKDAGWISESTTQEAFVEMVNREVIEPRKAEEARLEAEAHQPAETLPTAT